MYMMIEVNCTFVEPHSLKKRTLSIFFSSDHNYYYYYYYYYY